MFRCIIYKLFWSAVAIFLNQDYFPVFTTKTKKSVDVATICDTLDQLFEVQQWNRQKQSKVAISFYFLINQYNKIMGSVDWAVKSYSQNNLPDCYQDQKMGCAFFPWIPNMALQNTWILYRINRQRQDPNLDLIAFRRKIMDIYLKVCVCRNQSEKPRGKILPAKCSIKDETDHDRINHFSSSYITQKRCWICSKNTRKECSRCIVGIHYHCVKQWHDIQ